MRKKGIDVSIMLLVIFAFSSIGSAGEWETIIEKVD